MLFSRVHVVIVMVIIFIITWKALETPTHTCNTHGMFLRAENWHKFKIRACWVAQGWTWEMSHAKRRFLFKIWFFLPRACRQVVVPLLPQFGHFVSGASFAFRTSLIVFALTQCKNILSQCVWVNAFSGAHKRAKTLRLETAETA